MRFTPVDERVAYLRWWGNKFLLAFVPMHQTAIQSTCPVLESLEGVLKSALWTPLFCWGRHFNAQVGNDNETWKGVIERTKTHWKYCVSWLACQLLEIPPKEVEQVPGEREGSWGFPVEAAASEP